MKGKLNQVVSSSWNVQIWVGLKEVYMEDGITNRPIDKIKIHTIEEVYEICQKFVDKEKECVTVTPTEFVYTGGFESGVVIGFIQYPRFEEHQTKITQRAVKLGEILLKELNQYRLTVTTPKQSIMILKK